MSWKPATEPSRIDRWVPQWVPGWLRRLVKRTLKWGLLALTLLVAVGLFYFFLSLKYNLAEVAKMPERSAILDRHGEEIATVHGAKRRLITRGEIPEAMVQALLAREDARFYIHHGVDTKGLARAALRNIRDLSFTQGASTLTMQLTRNSFELRAKSLHRKLLEIAITLRIESRYGKDAILTHYLNRIYFGAGCHGIEEAAQTYFGRPASELNANECTMLAGIIRGPHLFSPFRNMEGALAQRDEVLERMVQCRYLRADQVPTVKAMPLRLVPEEDRHTSGSYVREAIRRQLNIILDRNNIRQGGLRIHTTLDIARQRRMQKNLSAPLPPVERGSRTDLQAAAVSIDPASGGILALSGGRDFSGSAYNRAYGIRRDLGPMFTPFLQAIALERSKVVIPRRPVQTGRQLGVAETTRLCRRLGFSGPFSETDDLYRGIVAASPVELARAAATLAAGGTRHAPHLVTLITDARGNALYRHTAGRTQVFSKDTADEALHLMGKNRHAYTTPTASLHDAWALSITPDSVTAVWLGHDKAKTIAAKAETTDALESLLRRVKGNTEKNDTAGTRQRR